MKSINWLMPTQTRVLNYGLAGFVVTLCAMILIYKWVM
jgi:hypothetical protein